MSRNRTRDSKGVYLHVIEVGNLALLVGDDGERDLGAGNLINVLDPSLVASEGVGGQADQLDTTLGEFRLKLSECTELGGADGSVVFGVGE
jgi:hypothetical protein